MVERTGRKPVKIEDFTGHVATLQAQNQGKLIEEFELLTINAPFTQHAARLLCNKAKNRYKNIAPCKLFSLCKWKQAFNFVDTSDDHSRVVLGQQDLVSGTDYINASHIDVSLYVNT